MGYSGISHGPHIKNLRGILKRKMGECAEAARPRFRRELRRLAKWLGEPEDESVQVADGANLAT